MNRERRSGDTASIRGRYDLPARHPRRASSRASPGQDSRGGRALGVSIAGGARSQFFRTWSRPSDREVRSRRPLPSKDRGLPPLAKNRASETISTQYKVGRTFLGMSDKRALQILF